MQIYDLRVVEAAGGFCRTGRPHFSWKLRSGKKDTKQVSFELCVFRGGEKVSSAGGEGECAYVLAEGEALLPRTRYEVRVTAEDNHGERAEEALVFETDKLSEPFAAKMIAPKQAPAPVYALKAKFTAKKPVKSARLYATALGLYECYFGGVKAGDSYFAPFWTSYPHTLEYQTYDVTSLIKEGENDFSMLIGKGWYAGALGFMKQRGIYGDKTAGMAEVRLLYKDGTEDVFATDETSARASTSSATLCAGGTSNTIPKIPCSLPKWASAKSRAFRARAWAFPSSTLPSTMRKTTASGATASAMSAPPARSTSKHLSAS